MSELLEMLINQKRVLMVATSKPTIFAEKILKYFNIDKYFDFICGSNLDGTMSDKTEIIRYIVKEKNINKQRAVMVGDRKHDIIGAHNNGIDSIGVSYGYGSKEEFKNSKPTHIIKSVQDFVRAFS